LANDKSCSSLLHANVAPASRFKWRGLFAVIAVSLVFTGLIKLGFWQLDRAKGKVELAQQLALQPHVELIEFPLGNIDKTLNQRGISVSGRLLHQYTWLLDNQVQEGKVGYQVLVAIALTGETKLGIVNLGWVAAPPDRSQLPSLKQWSAPRQFSGQLHLPTNNPYALASPPTSDWPKRIAQIDFSMLQQHTAQPIFEVVLRLDQDSATGYDKQWRWSNNMTVDKHRGYAFQWFALALTLLVLTAYFGYRLTKEV